MTTDIPALLGGTPVFASTLPLVRPVLPSMEEIGHDFASILSSGMVTKGRFLGEFERALAAHLGVRNAVCVSSCTVGLMLTMRALGLRGEVILPSYTFMASGTATIWAGLEPVLADVRPGSLNLDPARVDELSGPRTAAILGVHTFGNPADVDGLASVAAARGAKLVFDAAHGFGSLRDGRPVGGFGDAEVFSLSPTKLVIAGEGGVVATADDDLAARIRALREYGNRGDYGCDVAGVNGRMSEFHALMGSRSLARVEEAASARNAAAGRMRERLGRLPGLSFQEIRPQDRCSFKDFAVLVDPGEAGLTRDEMGKALAAENVDWRAYYDPPLHRMGAFSGARRGPLDMSGSVSGRVLCPPVHSRLDMDVVNGICSAFERISRNASRIKEVLSR